ncbi:1,4-dihydroxy-6-naphthoate synthase [Lignipirellula cremea]|uniref:1,4-dihydroxy-6-naphtoate synthase n=1 Tax=Lignipirellula cremea TaxID=2528010 RepID=A0A518DXZ9_9BACT|nr:1,4-dihydroxy-6-naphthoate synthase [Lignipirellula cremea]QDU96718.1 1,4-dihydroxy-6-naphtoate synthase [Lignipirellula cremea]
MSRPIHLGISTCPNDTFAFHGILEKKVDLRGLEFRTELLDVQELNDRLFRGDFDVAKASFHAALLLADELGVLSSGSALGFGVGPLLLSAQPDSRPEDAFVDDRGGPRSPRVLCPGRTTTAALLYQLFHPGQGRIEHVVFSEIMPALQQGAADFGVCIHEGRFTWQEHGLGLVEDLGQVWEQATQAPLPLGGILARHALGAETLHAVQQVVADSVAYGLANREETAATMRRYAQEFNDDVLYAHVDLYVNAYTEHLGEAGSAALAELAQRAAAAGVIPHAAQLTVIE